MYGASLNLVEDSVVGRLRNSYGSGRIKLAPTRPGRTRRRSGNTRTASKTYNVVHPTSRRFTTFSRPMGFRHGLPTTELRPSASLKPARAFRFHFRFTGLTSGLNNANRSRPTDRSKAVGIPVATVQTRIDLLVQDSAGGSKRFDTFLLNML